MVVGILSDVWVVGVRGHVVVNHWIVVVKHWVVVDGLNLGVVPTCLDVVVVVRPAEKPAEYITRTRANGASAI